MTVTQRGLDHRDCNFSTGICDEITAGQGERDEHGYFAIDCPECAAKMTRNLAERFQQVFASRT
jgi:hypothetical protein